MASVEKRTRNGATRWYARWRDDDGRQRVKVFDRRSDAVDYLARTSVALATGSYVDPRAGKVTLSAWHEVWAARQVGSASTARSVDLAVRSCTFRGVPLGRVTLGHVESWVKSMSADGLAPSTIRQRVDCVRTVLRAAVRDKLITSDPTAGVALPRVPRKSLAMRIPTPEQVAAILDASPGDVRAGLLLAAFAGLRAGEVCGLRVADVDFLRRAVSVRRQVQIRDGVPVELPPKSTSSERTVPVDAAVLDLVAARVVPGSSYVVERRPGVPHTPRTLGYAWSRACEAAGVDGYTLHDARHFYASGLIAAGLDVVAVSHALGHHSPTVTLGTYAHLWPSAEDVTRAASGQLLAAVLDAGAGTRRVHGPTRVGSATPD